MSTTLRLPGSVAEIEASPSVDTADIALIETLGTPFLV